MIHNGKSFKSYVMSKDYEALLKHNNIKNTQNISTKYHVDSHGAVNLALKLSNNKWSYSALKNKVTHINPCINYVNDYVSLINKRNSI